MVDSIIITEGLFREIRDELKTLGACDLCTMRYLLVKDPYTYRTPELTEKLLKEANLTETTSTNSNSDHSDPDKSHPKLHKTNPCSVCLGLLQECTNDDCLDQIAKEIHKAEIQAASYAAMLSLPIAVLIRAYSMWFHLIDKFPSVYKSMIYFKPEGVALKSVWKWICTSFLKQKVDPTAEWMTEGDLVLNIFLKYGDEQKECGPLLKLLRNERKRVELTRTGAEQAFQTCNPEVFRDFFPCPPEIPQHSLSFDYISCSHMAIFVAGRYCKYSRDVSQSPWLNDDGSRVRGEGSVQEFISAEVTPMFNCEQVRFSSAGREDTDVRMLGRGRPFVLEIINPKKTIFTPEQIQKLQLQINNSTNMISVRDLQIVDKKDLTNLKEGEDSKLKMYTALCHTPGHTVTDETIALLNSVEMPLVLQQITPLRVLHRRSLITRPRSIYNMKVRKAKKSDEMFILDVTTQAGTYVKEFVHGDFGRTLPSVTTLLGYTTEILSLDVSNVELDWPPEINFSNNYPNKK